MNRTRSQKIDSVQGWLSPVSDGYGKPGLGIGTIYGSHFDVGNRAMQHSLCMYRLYSIL